MGRNKHKRVGFFNRSKVTAPTSPKINNKFGVVLFHQSILNQISAICKPAAGSSEFQVHYHSLITRVWDDEVEFNVVIPLAFYNFPQEVSAASVHYDLIEVKQESDKVAGIADDLAEQYLSQMPILSALKEMGMRTEIQIVDNGSIHRHPSRFSFSTVDLDTDPTNPGVIFRQAKADDMVQMDSVIFLGSQTEIVTSEMRIVNVQPAEDGGVEGTYDLSPTLSIINKDSIPAVNKLSGLLGEAPTENNTGDFLKVEKGFKYEKYPVLDAIIKAFQESELRPDLSNIDPERIKSKSYQHYNYNRGIYGKKAEKLEPKTTHVYDKKTKQVKELPAKSAATLLDTEVEEMFEDEDFYFGMV